MSKEQDQFTKDLAANNAASDKLDKELNTKDNKPKLEFAKDGSVKKLELDNDTNKETVITGKKNDESSPNKPVPSNTLGENLLKNPTAGANFDQNKDPITNLTNEEKGSTSLRTMPDGSVGLVSPGEKVVEGSIVSKNLLHPGDKKEDESPSQKKVRVLQEIHTILKIGGMDSQQQQKALVQLNELLFDDNDVMDMSKKFPETGNEPAGSVNPNTLPKEDKKESESKADKEVKG